MAPDPRSPAVFSVSSLGLPRQRCVPSLRAATHCPEFARIGGVPELERTRGFVLPSLSGSSSHPLSLSFPVPLSGARRPPSAPAPPALSRNPPRPPPPHTARPPSRRLRPSPPCGPTPHPPSASASPSSTNTAPAGYHGAQGRDQERGELAPRVSACAASDRGARGGSGGAAARVDDEARTSRCGKVETPPGAACLAVRPRFSARAARPERSPCADDDWRLETYLLVLRPPPGAARLATQARGATRSPSPLLPPDRSS